ncbi:DUF3887 domain-containing protein [Thermococcus sp.]|uniref:DUF3887 domain-containing protein n=1 Tax=Thermococcus sp. TaxID=35749 RepID=UPI0026206E64|nr:DUF3887 domain-containing protein [Thermococcus sp.]
MNRFVEAVDTGNYSLIEPYLGEELRDQFTEDYFNQVRAFILENYGKPLAFEPVSNSTSGDLVRYEYTVRCERGSFPVLLAYKNGQLVGIALGVKARLNPAGMLLTMLGSLLSLGVLYLWRRKLEVADFILGAGIALGLGIILPFYSLITVGLSRITGVLLSSLLIALTVEGSKYYFSRKRDGFSLGLGFGVGKYVFLAIGTFVATNFILKLPVSFSGGLAYAFLSALIFTAFHGLTAMLYSAGRVEYLPIFTIFQFISLSLMALGRPGVAMLTAGAGLVLAAYLGVRRNGIP